jgi:8-amino-7-oxononanoate synthase
MFQLHHTPGRNVFVNDREMLFFSGYAYLGLNLYPDFLRFVIEGMQQFGAVYPSSRISNTQLELYSSVEKYLSELTHTTDTVLFQSGYMAGKAVTEIIPTDSIVYTSPVCHPAIRTHQPSELSFIEWASQIVSNINSSHFTSPPVIVSDAVNPLTAEVFDFSFLNHIHQPVICITDDSHGIGIIGKDGEGISSRLPRKENIEYIISYSLSKAMSVQAGAVSCTNAATAKALKAGNWFTATTPPSPAMLYALLHSKHIFHRHRQQLADNLHFLQTAAASLPHIYFNEELPVIILPENLDETYFAGHQIIISSFAYPNPQGKKINRAVISALHTKDDLQQLLNAIAKSSQ